MEHRPTASRPNNFEIARTERVAIGQEEGAKGTPKEETNHFFSLLYFSYHCFAFLLGRIHPLCQSLLSALRATGSHFDLQEPSSIVEVHLLENPIRQSQTINPPAALGWHWHRSVIEVLIFGFQKAVIDFVQLIGEDLLRRIGPVRNRIRAKKDSILVFLEELPGHARLPAELSDAGPQLHVHIGKAVHAFADVGKILCVIA